MFFDIGIGIHVESQLNTFRFVDDISSKMAIFPVSEIWGRGGGPQFHAHLYIFSRSDFFTGISQIAGLNLILYIVSTIRIAPRLQKITFW
jgi:hypothetical protein